MSKPHPSMALTLDLDESIVDHELRLEIDRCYSYLGTPVVRTHPAADGEPVNTLRMTVRVGAREYLDSSVEGADALWSDSIEHWLLNQVHAVDNQMKIFNRRDPEESKWVSRVREALNAGALGKDVVAVTLPSAASYEKQYAAGMEALETRKEAEAAAARAAEEAAAAEAEAAEKAAEESFMASPALVAEAAEAALEAEEAADIVVRARIAHDLEEVERGELDKTAEEIVAERIAEEAHLGEDIQKKYALPDADFALAFDQWTVVYADGSTRDFDSTSGILAD